MLRAYLKESLTVAARSSWRAANGLFGAAIAGAALIWPGVQNFTSRTNWWADAANWLLSFAIYALVAWIILFILQLIFVAPFQLWRSERNLEARLPAER
jgi:TRAP-type C4-dicarboxylate transport system permease small subunit